jgi:GNAT superfamily N-acetyltransferase
MNLSFIDYHPQYYSILKELYTQLQLFEAGINAYRSTDMTKISQMIDELLETIKEKSGKLVFAKENNTFVGFIAFYKDNDVLNVSDHVYISDLLVTKDHRGKGIARLLIDHVDQYAKLLGIKTIRVAVFRKK